MSGAARVYDFVRETKLDQEAAKALKKKRENSSSFCDSVESTVLTGIVGYLCLRGIMALLNDR